MRKNARFKLSTPRRGLRRQTLKRTRQRSIIKRDAPAKAQKWSSLVPADEWAIYRGTLRLFRESGVQFMIGGGFCWASYTQHWRNTKDLDIFVAPRDREKSVQLLTKAGFEDYFNRRPYDRGWIYRGFKNGNIVDVIWSMANRRAAVDQNWFQRAHQIKLRGEVLRILSPEDLLWCKLYVLQRDHCDWPDLMNLLEAVGPQLDWRPLLNRLGPDIGILRSLLHLFAWLAPNRARELPSWLRRRMNMPLPTKVSRKTALYRARLLDSRDWLASAQPKNKPLAI